MTVPYQFANATGNINLAELDANFDSLGVFSQNAATVTASAQPNVTALGTLVSLGVTGNIRSINGYLFGDGRFITNLPAANGTYGNANVATYLPTYTGILNPSTVDSANITTANLAVTNIGTFARSVTMSQGLQVTGDVNSYGNVIGRNFVSASGNANVANVNANAVSTVGLTATGLVTVGTLIPTTITGNGNIFANFITANANLTVSGRITSTGVVIANQGFTTSQNVQANNVTASNAVTTATVTATGNITGGNILAGAYYYANGQPFTGGGSGTNYSNANVASFLAVNTGPINGGNLSVTLVNSNGNITGANLTVSGNVTAAGIVATNYQANANIHAGGTLTAVGAAQVGSLATNGNITGGNLITAGLISSGGNITGANINGNGSGLSSLTGANVTGTVTNATFATSANIAATVTTNAQPNITSVGTLTSVTVTGNINAGNVIATSFIGSGAQLTGINGPIFMAYNSSNSNLTNPGNVLRFSTTTVNTNNYYNTSTGVFTPLVPGYYQVNVSFLPELVSGSANASFFTGLYKNGSLIAIGGSTTVTPTWGDISCSAISTLVYLNGSSDYLGIATTNTIYSGSWRTGISVVNYFQATWVHA